MKHWLLATLFACSLACASRPPSRPLVVPPDADERVAFDAGVAAFDAGRFADARRKFSAVLALGWHDGLRRQATLGLFCVQLMEDPTPTGQTATVDALEDWLRGTAGDDFKSVRLLLPYVRRISVETSQLRERSRHLGTVQAKARDAIDASARLEAENQELKQKIEQLEQLHVEMQAKKKSIP